MTMREKLIELLQDDDCPLLYVLGENIGTLADYLIANGVTIQKWIPVTERLPEKSDWYMAITYIKSVMVLPFSAKNRAFNSFDSDYVTDKAIECSHWMPLPTPPADLPKITEQTKNALEKMGEKAHGGNDG